jgi:alpha-maltose-1-phosphate synthase
MSLTIDLVTTLEEAERLAPAWEALANACGTRGTATPSYCLEWWRHCGRGRLLIVAVSDATGLVALGPFHQRRIAGLKVVRFLGHGLGTVSELLVAAGREDAAEAAWAALARPRRQVLQLLEYRYNASGLLALRRATGWEARLELRDVCPVLALDESLDTLLAARERRNLRRSLSTGQRNLRQEGLLHHVDILTQWEQLLERLGEIQTILDAVERDRGRLNLLAPPWRQFTMALLSREAAAGRLAVFLGTIGGRPASVIFTLRAGRSLGYWVPRFHPAFERFRPGHLLMRELVAFAYADRDLDEVDLLLGDHEYKRRWSSSSYDTLRVEAAAPGRLAPMRALMTTVDRTYRVRQALRHRTVAGTRTNGRG